jgi:hypothetical protein
MKIPHHPDHVITRGVEHRAAHLLAEHFCIRPAEHFDRGFIQQRGVRFVRGEVA